MGIFGGSRRQVFKPSPYDTRRRSKGLPRWFILLALGILFGAGGVLILQASYGPKRLTVLESQKLTDDLAAVSLERQQLQSSLNEIERTLNSEREQFKNEVGKLKQEISSLTTRLKPLREEVSMFTNAITAGLKFDPIGIAGASFEQTSGDQPLSYHILLVQEDENKPQYAGRIEVTFEGRYPNGRAGAVKALVVPFNLGHYEHLTGSVEMPNGFRASRATLRVYEADGQRALSYRTYSVDG